MSIGSAQANFDRLSVENADDFQQMKREAAQAKLHYLRDLHSPEEFDILVDEELDRAAIIVAEPEIHVKKVVQTIKKKISTLLKRKLT
jgi:hypothetical protein